MLTRLFSKFRSPEPAPVETEDEGPFSTHIRVRRAADVHAEIAARLKSAAPKAVRTTGTAMDSAANVASIATLDAPSIGEALYSWYGSQSFIGHQMAALLSQHWLIDKACTMPARDAVRHGFQISLTGETTPAHLEAITKANKRFRINHHLRQFVGKGRVFGLRIAIFKVEGFTATDYARPFNIDAVKPGKYRGIVQVDPYWCQPELDGEAAANPASGTFYEPTWWRINGVRYHRSHLCIFRTGDLSDMLRPAYLYGGVPIPQKIMERVYAAERTANEGPQLALSKRLDVWKTDVAALLGNQEKFALHMANMVAMRDNYGVKIADTEDEWSQFDTTLSGFDELIMTQYQIVAAAANVPATKLLGTTPKGFNATGEYEEASYHEELETIQENDLDPLMERHLELVLRSEIEPQFSHKPGDIEAVLEWNPVDSPTAKEAAETNKLKAETDQILVNSGAIDGLEVRDRLRADKDSGYAGIQDALEEAEQELDEAVQALGVDPDTGAIDPAAKLDAALAELPPVDPVAALERLTAELTGDGFDLPRAAGVILIRANGDALWVKRRPNAVDEPGKWAWPGGMIDPGEKPQDAAIRELFEETGIEYGAPISPVGVVDGFVVFTAVSVAALEVRLCDEHTAYEWRPLSDPPKPLHKGCKAFLNG